MAKAYIKTMSTGSPGNALQIIYDLLCCYYYGDYVLLFAFLLLFLLLFVGYDVYDILCGGSR